MLQKIVTLLYLSGDPLAISTIAKILNTTEDEIKKNIEEVSNAVKGIGLYLLYINNELSIVSSKEQSSLVEGFWKSELEGELTPATLQVLTLVAYLGNPTREEISYIRGVQSSQSIRTLTVRGLIKRQGEICALTSDAYKQLGITKEEELPDYTQIHTSFTEKLKTRDI